MVFDFIVKGDSMDINYHYYTIKTLAVHAGFEEEEAQFVAYFSQQVDDFIMHSPFIVDKEPPDFFLKNGLAKKINSNRWVFSPCTTGINILHTVSHSFQLDTLMPFHFIMPVVNYGVPQNIDRSFYRCKAANEQGNLLINQLVENTASSVKLNDKTSLMALGMILHTLSDTYAHCGFSGFHGWENESYVHKMVHKLPQAPKQRLVDFAKEKLFGAKNPHETISPAEIAFYRALPSIGHANVSHAPDCCDCNISLYGKRTKSSALEPMIERDNSEFFADCSRRILDILCTINNRPKFDAAAWENLQKKLSHAQNESGKAIRRKWMEVFPDITYLYTKKEFVCIVLDLLHHDARISNKLEVNKKDLTNMHSEKGDKARISSLILARNVSDFFYTYNELAYRHVYNVNGEYASRSHFTRLSAYNNLASSAKI